MIYRFTPEYSKLGVIRVLHLLAHFLGLVFLISLLLPVDMSIHTWKMIQLYGGILTGLLLIVSAYATYRIYVIEMADKVLAGKKVALTGELVAPEKKDSVEADLRVYVKIGSNHFGVKKSRLIDGYEFTPVQFSDRKTPITIKLVNNKLRVSCSFTSLDGNIVAEIIENEWQINPNNYFRRNYDDQGLEVIDAQGIMKFQIDLVNENEIVVGGFFKFGNIYFTQKETYMFNPNHPTEESEIIQQHSSNVAYMFVYPETSHFGERVKK